MNTECFAVDGFSPFTPEPPRFGLGTYTLPHAENEKPLLRRGFDAFGYVLNIVSVGWNPPAMRTRPRGVLTSASWSKSRELFNVHTLYSKRAYNDIVKDSCVSAVAAILDAKSAERLLRLSRSENNWDGEGGKALSALALFNFYNFLCQSKEAPRSLRLFLGADGELVTSWDLKDGSTIDMSFGDHQIELATDLYDEIFPVGDARLFQLISEL